MLLVNSEEWSLTDPAITVTYHFTAGDTVVEGKVSYRRTYRRKRTLSQGAIIPIIYNPDKPTTDNEPAIRY